MKVTVLGATGKAGRHVVEQALADGHEVTALARTPAKLDIRHERLRVVQGDVEDAERLEQAVTGADAVISTVGQTKTSSPELLERLAQNLVPAMQKQGVRRLVTLVGAGVPDERDEGSLGRSFMRGLMKLVARKLLEDAERHAQIVRSSDLDWTLVRPPRLTDGERQGQYRTGYLRLGPKESISRADVAEFMLDLAGNGRYVREAPMVSY
jgi:putative NADH-flavin reductase